MHTNFLSKESPPKKPTSRIYEIDALRGFALFGIIVTHSCYMYFNTIDPVDATANYSNASVLDKIINALVLTLVSGKFYIIFSLLFGLSFAIQMLNAKKKGEPFVLRFLWRLVLLFGIGYLHALVFNGDILRIYALLGVFLVACSSLKNKTLLILSALFYGISILAVLFQPHVIAVVDPIMKQANKTFLYSIINMDNIGFLIRSGRLFVTFGLFLMGLYFGRNNSIGSFIDNDLLQKKAMVWTSVIAIVCTLSMGGIAYTSLHTNTFAAFISVVAISLQKVSLSAFYICAFIYLYKKAPTQKWLSWLIPVGKTGLSMYIMQSLFLVSWYSLPKEILIQTGLISSLFCTILFFIVQILLSSIWIKHFEYGPIEWLWRSLIYFKVQSFTKKNNNSLIQT